MASVLGLPRIKGTSHKIIACFLQKGFKPKAGQAVSAVSNPMQPLVIPFNGDFFGIVTEVRENPERCTVVCAGLSIAVLKENVAIDPALNTFFSLSLGILTGELGVEVSGQIVKIDEPVYPPKSDKLLANNGALIDIDNASTISTTPPNNDFNQLDFLAADFA